VFPLTTVQTRIIHLIRNSLAFVSWKDRKLIMPKSESDLPGGNGRGPAPPSSTISRPNGERYPAIGQA
jgi:putative transposase